MKKLLMITAMVVAVVAPASAQEPTQLQRARELAIMIGYEMKCGDLPPKTKADLERWNYNPAGFGIDGDLVMTEGRNVLQQVKTIGKEKWCAAFQPTVHEMEAAR